MNTLPKNWAIESCKELADFANWIDYDEDLFYTNSDIDLDVDCWGIVHNTRNYKIITFDQFKQYYNTVTYTNNVAFWNRLKTFIECVQVHDAMSEEEQDMIINVCNVKINQLK